MWGELQTWVHFFLRNRKIILLNLENKIILTEKLLRSLNKEEKIISERIFNTENKIYRWETLLNKLKKQLINRLQYLYINGRFTTLETILSSNDWNNIIYKIKYLDVLSLHEKKVRKKMQNTLASLSEVKTKLLNELNLKNRLINEKKREGINLENDKQKRKVLLAEIKHDRGNLQKNRQLKNKQVSELE